MTDAPASSAKSTATAVSAALPDVTTLSDEELVRLAQERGGRDDRPFRELFRRHQTGVWRTCYRYMNNREDAEDLTQDVFFKAYRSLPRFEGRSSFKTWVYRIAMNTAQNELRRRSRRPQESETTVETMAETMPSTQRSGRTPESLVVERSEHDVLAQAYQRLRPPEQEVLRLKDLEDWPYADIAARLGISLSAAKMRVQRARLALRDAYETLLTGDETHE